MVKSVTSVGRSGLHDWMIQRVSAVILAAYSIYIGVFVLSTPDLHFSVWQGLFAQTEIKIFSFLAILSLCFHAWIGLWIISTDYLNILALRLVFQVVVIILCLAFLLWGAQILWGF
ncbi:MAG: succinate dehydrogenase, hydrophobic membrane anchor protein [Kangiellaceae bacterium]|nr:succinate dehydrogenase, hydrophobic membrane anchor protein [Kangiellaceae bacterium]